MYTDAHVHLDLYSAERLPWFCRPRAGAAWG